MSEAQDRSKDDFGLSRAAVLIFFCKIRADSDLTPEIADGCKTSARVCAECFGLATSFLVEEPMGTINAVPQHGGLHLQSRSSNTVLNYCSTRSASIYNREKCL